MKHAFGLMVATAVIMAGCDKTDEHKKVVSEINKVYQDAATAQKPSQVGDAAAGKAVATKICSQCHGMDGVHTNAGAPFIAGLDQDYIVRSMLFYTDGTRKNDLMKESLNGLTPDDIANVSEYYATLKTPWKGANIGAVVKKPLVPTDKATVAAGAAVAEQCFACHGTNGNIESDDVMPALAGMSPEYFIPALKSYFATTKKRDDELMAMFGDSLTEPEIKQLAAFFAVQPPKKPPQPESGNIKAGEAAAGECAGCHGIDGNSLNPDIPSLAGHPAKYLEKAIKDYRDGKRRDYLMSAAVKKMKDSTILNLAAYYAKQTPASHATVKDGGRFDPIGDGKKIAAACDGCHGKNGNSEKPGIPSLTGMHVKYLASATKEYRDGARKNNVMKRMVSHLSDTDIEKVGFYYALQTPVVKLKQPQADLEAGKKLSENCTSCHGEGGISTNPTTPSLAGQGAGYLRDALKAYATGVRHNEAMTGPAKELKPADLTNVAAYFASLAPQKPNVIVPEKPQVSMVEKCNRCHGENGHSTQVGIPSLAGQSEAYLALALKEYQEGTRKNKYMNAMSDVLSLVEIKAMAAHYARQPQH